MLADLAAARSLDNPGVEEARAFFEQNFILPDVFDQVKGFVTAFYEPEIEASLEADTWFKVPFLREPDDLVKVTDESRPPYLIRPCLCAPDGKRPCRI